MAFFRDWIEPWDELRVDWDLLPAGPDRVLALDFGLPIALFTVAAERSQRTSLLAWMTILVLFTVQWAGGVGVLNQPIRFDQSEDLGASVMTIGGSVHRASSCNARS